MARPPFFFQRRRMGSRPPFAATCCADDDVDAARILVLRLACLGHRPTAVLAAEDGSSAASASHCPPCHRRDQVPGPCGGSYPCRYRDNWHSSRPWRRYIACHAPSSPAAAWDQCELRSPWRRNHLGIPTGQRSHDPRLDSHTPYTDVLLIVVGPTHACEFSSAFARSHCGGVCAIEAAVVGSLPTHQPTWPAVCFALQRPGSLPSACGAWRSSAYLATVHGCGRIACTVVRGGATTYS